MATSQPEHDDDADEPATEAGSDRPFDFITEIRRLAHQFLTPERGEDSSVSEDDATMQINELARHMDDRFDLLSSQIVSVRDEQSRTTGAFSTAITSLNETVVELRDELRSTTSELRVAIGELRDEMRSTTGQLQVAVGELRSTTGELQVAVGELRDELRANTSRLDLAVTELRGEVKVLASRTDELGATQRELSTAVVGLTAAVGELRGAMRTIDSRVESVFWKQTLAAAGLLFAVAGVAAAIVFGLIELL